MTREPNLSPSSKTRPSDDMIVLALLLRGPRWLYADEIRGTLKALGWECSAQQVGSWLARLEREDVPMITSRDGHGMNEWAVTRWGRNQIENHYPCARRMWEIIE